MPASLIPPKTRNAMPEHQTMIMTPPRMLTPSCCPPQPGKKAPQGWSALYVASVLSLVPKSPPQIKPKKPHPMWTALASRGSSIFSFCTPIANQNSTQPAKKPMTQQAQGSATATAEQTPTRPPKIPLHRAGRSRYPSLTKHMQIPASPPPLAARVVPTATFSAARMKPPDSARVDPELNPNQPNHKRRVPRPTKAELWGMMGTTFPVASNRPIRGPRMYAATREIVPPTKCTTPLPAKSTTPLAIQTPGASGFLNADSHPYSDQIQWTTTG
mmetsp:Transcript_11968/g.33090  ORF Transcript_11968/g.33090 Transcript_11968/m.33090 type:complete len:272 (-) Transcript_11968:602-1417(-)